MEGSSDEQSEGDVESIGGEMSGSGVLLCVCMHVY